MMLGLCNIIEKSVHVYTLKVVQSKNASQRFVTLGTEIEDLFRNACPQKSRPIIEDV